MYRNGNLPDADLISQTLSIFFAVFGAFLLLAFILYILKGVAVNENGKKNGNKK